MRAISSNFLVRQPSGGYRSRFKTISRRSPQNGPIRTYSTLDSISRSQRQKTVDLGPMGQVDVVHFPPPFEGAKRVLFTQGSPGSNWEWYCETLPRLVRANRFEVLAPSAPGLGFSVAGPGWTHAMELHGDYLLALVRHPEIGWGNRFEIVANSAGMEQVMMMDALARHEGQPLDIRKVAMFAPWLPSIVHCDRSETAWGFLDNASSMRLGPFDLGYHLTRWFGGKLLAWHLEIDRLVDQPRSEVARRYHQGHEPLFLDRRIWNLFLRHEVAISASAVHREQKRIVHHLGPEYASSLQRPIEQFPSHWDILHYGSDGDRIVRMSYQDRLVSFLEANGNQVQRRVFEGRSHLLHVEYPDLFLDELIAFLDEN